MKHHTSRMFLVMSLTLLVALSACYAPAAPVTAPEPAVGAEPAAEEAGTVILRAGTGDSGEGLTPHQSIIADFEDQNPGILVQLEAIAGRDYYTRILTQIAAGRAPDIMQIGDDAVPSFVDKGAFLPWTSAWPS